MIATTVVAFAGVPAESWRVSPADPCHLATIAGALTVVTLVVTRRFGRRAYRFERLLTAGFLAAMPLVYVGSYYLYGAHAGPAWRWIELSAVAFFGALAVAGLRGRPALLVLGIAAHGAFWDLWHFGTSHYIPSWYAAGCLALDVAMALYIGTRLSRWQEAARSAALP